MANSYVTVYGKDGSAHFTYAATVQEWLATGEYTLEAPGAPGKPPELEKAKLPSAGREANRDNPITSGAGPMLTPESMVPASDAEPAPAAAPAEDAPVRPAPRRRAAAEG